MFSQINHNLEPTRTLSSRRRRRIDGGNDRQIRELAGAFSLIHSLVIHIEGIRSIFPSIQHPTRRTVSEARAVRISARIADAVVQFGIRSARLGRHYAPLPGQILDSFGRSQTSSLSEIQRVFDASVEIENPPVALEIPRIYALGVLV